MKFFLYFLTIAFGIVCFVIMKKKRYKVMPLICLIMFICFIGFGIISLVYSFVPYGEIFVMEIVFHPLKNKRIKEKRHCKTTY